MKIEVIETIDKGDGSAIISFDMSEDVVDLFVRQGLKIALEKITDEYMVVPVNEWDKWVEEGNAVPAARSYELSSQEVQAYFQIGTYQAIVDGIESVTAQQQLKLDFGGDDGC